VIRRAPDTASVFLIALVARLLVVAWASNLFPPIADGTYYDILGRRIAQGQGYTWLWPDGAVTYAAHYPVGYPGIVALAYTLFGPHPGAAMFANAVFGALGAAAMHAGVAAVLDRKPALVLATLGFALHPALLLYTPALMTEGVCASLVACAVAPVLIASRGASDGFSLRRGLPALAALGVAVGVATLVRPQLLLFAPLFGFGIAFARERRVAKSLGAAAITGAVALVVIAPWTLRNCDKMGKCALVSLNGGWNLHIGTYPDAQGTWAQVRVPPPCEPVFDEAEKDSCLAREGARTILTNLPSWLALAPKKLAATFNHVGAGPWYMHDSNREAFSERARFYGGAIEELFQRVFYALGLFAVARVLTRSASLPTGRLCAVGAAVVGLAAPGWWSVLAFSLLAPIAVVRPATARREALLLATASCLTLVTALTHVVFFGAGRYSLVVIPAWILAAAALFCRDSGSTAEPGPQGF
jgi:hypothetical protein